jgi:hypothetical protein
MQYRYGIITIGVVALAIIGIFVFPMCGGEACFGISQFRFLHVSDDIYDSQTQYYKLLNDPKFVNTDTFGVSGFIDSREECSNYKRAAQSLSLYNNNLTNSQAWESKAEAILIYQMAREHGCNID